MSAASVVSTTYLELSQEGDGAHKFYEVTVDGLTVTVRYGRIGAAGQTQTTTFPTVEKARAAAAKKVGDKVRKGYAPAVQGQRAPRSVTRRQVSSAPSTARAVAPVLWRFRTGSAAFGIHVDDQHCWVGNQAGDVYTLDHEGGVRARFNLPDGVKCLVADDFWIYAGCDDGKVYDLSSKLPFAAYDIAADVDIFWLDIHEGILNVSDRAGRLTVIDHEDEHQWARRSRGEHAWMVRADDRAVYHGHQSGVTAYAPDGAASCGTAPPGAVCSSAGRRTTRCTRAPPTAWSSGCPRRTAPSRRRTPATARCTPVPPHPADDSSSPVTPPRPSTASTGTARGFGSSVRAAARRCRCSTATSGSIW